MSNFDIVIKALKQRGGVATSDQLRSDTNLTEIPARITEARAAGYEINTTLVDDISRGFKRKIAEYAFIREASDD